MNLVKQWSKKIVCLSCAALLCVTQMVLPVFARGGTPYDEAAGIQTFLSAEDSLADASGWAVTDTKNKLSISDGTLTIDRLTEKVVSQAIKKFSVSGNSLTCQFDVRLDCEPTTTSNLGIQLFDGANRTFIALLPGKSRLNTGSWKDNTELNLQPNQWYTYRIERIGGKQTVLAKAENDAAYTVLWENFDAPAWTRDPASIKFFIENIGMGAKIRNLSVSGWTPRDNTPLYPEAAIDSQFDDAASPGNSWEMPASASVANGILTLAGASGNVNLQNTINNDDFEDLVFEMRYRLKEGAANGFGLQLLHKTHRTMMNIKPTGGMIGVRTANNQWENIAGTASEPGTWYTLRVVLEAPGPDGTYRQSGFWKSENEEDYTCIFRQMEMNPFTSSKGYMKLYIDKDPTTTVEIDYIRAISYTTVAPPPVYAVTVDGNIQYGSVSALPVEAEAGETITLTATSDEDYEFVSWKVTCGGKSVEVTDNSFVMPDGDVTVSAVFREIIKESYQLAVTPAEHGTITANPAGDVAVGATVTLSVVADPGYKLEQLMVDGSDRAVSVEDGIYTFVMPTHNVTVSASFEGLTAAELLKAAAVAAGISEECIARGESIAKEDAIPEASRAAVAAAVTDSKQALELVRQKRDALQALLDGEAGAVQSASEELIASQQVLQDKTNALATACDTAEENRRTLYVIAVSSGNGGSAAVNCKSAYDGDTVSVSVSANSGYALDRLVVDGASVASRVVNGVYTFAMPAHDVEIEATFRRTSSGGGSGGGSSSGGGKGKGYTGNYNLVLDALNTPQPVSSTQQPALPFDDLADVPWAQEAICSMETRGVLQGVAPRQYAPNRTVTRAELAKMLVGVFGYQLSNSGASVNFEDVADGAWYTPYIAAAVKNGLMNGCSEQEFVPNRPVTREELAVVLKRALDLPSAEAMNFADAAQISGYAKDAVASMYAAGLISGYEDGSFLPKESATRAETAVLLYRAENRRNGS